MTPEAERIMSVWDALDDDDITTDTLIQMVADHCRVSTDDVMSALAEYDDEIKKEQMS